MITVIFLYFPSETFPFFETKEEKFFENKKDKSSWETIAITFIELVYLKVLLFCLSFGNKSEMIKEIIINGGAVR